MSHLELTSRMQPIALSDLVDAGFRKFCWIHPEEQPGGVSLSGEVSYAHGAFAYQTTGGSIFYALSMQAREGNDEELGTQQRGGAGRGCMGKGGEDRSEGSSGKGEGGWLGEG